MSDATGSLTNQTADSPRPNRNPAIQNFALPLLLIVVLTLVFLSPILPPFTHEVRLGDDIRAQFYPWKFLFRESVRAGVFPLWNPLLFCGAPFLANPQTALLYPDSPFYLAFDPKIVFPWDQAFHLALAGFGAYLLLFHYTRSRIAALFSAIVYILNAFMAHRILMGHFSWLVVLSLAPYLMLFLERLLLASDNRRGILWGFALGAVFALDFMAGHPEMTLMLALMLTLRFAWELAAVLRSGARNRVISLLLRGVLAALAGIGLSAVQLLPTLEYAGQTARVQTEYDLLKARSMPPLNLATILIPEALGGIAQHNSVQGALAGEMAIYSGILTLVLAIAGMVLCRDSPTRFYATVALVSLLLSLGPYTPLYKLAFALPGLKMVAAPLRYSFLWTFAQTFLSGLSLATLLSSDFDRKRLRQLVVLLFISAGVAAVLTVAFLLLRGKVLSAFTHQIEVKYPADTSRRLAKLPDFYAQEVRGLVALVVLLAGCGALLRARLGDTMDGERNRQIWGIAALLLVLADLTFFHFKCIQAVAKWEEEPTRGSGAYGFLANHAPDSSRYMAIQDAGISPNYNLFVGARNALGYDPLILKPFRDYVIALEGKPEKDIDIRAPLITHYRSPLVPRLGVRYLMSREPLSDPDLIEVYDGKTDINGVRVYESRRADPLAWVCHNPVSMGSEAEILAALQRGEGGYADGRAFAVSFGNMPITPSTAPPELVSAYQWQGMNRLRIEVTAAHPGLLVVNEPFYPDWKTAIDGVPTPTVRVNYLMRGVGIGAGKHTVEMVYEPKSVQTGIIVSVASLILVLVSALVATRFSGGSRPPGS